MGDKSKWRKSSGVQLSRALGVGSSSTTVCLRGILNLRLTRMGLQKIRESSDTLIKHPGQ